MCDGKKEKAEKVFLDVLSFISIKEEKNSYLILFRALENVRPFVGLRAVRRGSAVYQVPTPLFEKRSVSLAIKWILNVAKKKKGPLSLNVALCIIDASKNVGDCVKSRDNLHNTALKNRSFTHFRWF
jgi:small subunit ribosomal protein S7